MSAARNDIQLCRHSPELHTSKFEYLHVDLANDQARADIESGEFEIFIYVRPGEAPRSGNRKPRRLTIDELNRNVGD